MGRGGADIDDGNDVGAEVVRLIRDSIPVGAPGGKLLRLRVVERPSDGVSDRWEYGHGIDVEGEAGARRIKRQRIPVGAPIGVALRARSAGDHEDGVAHGRHRLENVVRDLEFLNVDREGGSDAVGLDVREKSPVGAPRRVEIRDVRGGIAQERLPGLLEVAEHAARAGNVPMEPDFARPLAADDRASRRKREIELDAVFLRDRAECGLLISVPDVAVDGDWIERAAKSGAGARVWERDGGENGKDSERGRGSDGDSPRAKGA